MTAVTKVAIAGTGVAGLAAAIQLTKAGVEVDVFESKPEPSVLGSGITIQGNALRVFDALGVWDDVRAQGYFFEGLTLRAPGPNAPVIAELPEVKTGGPDYPACGGMNRPDLAKLLLSHAEKVGVNARFGAAVTGIEQTADGVDVLVNGESIGIYDLLIGADGLHSTVRGLIGIEAAPQPTGMGIWRAFVSRPAEVLHSEIYFGGPMYIAGYTPTGEDTMYAFVVSDAKEQFQVSAEEATNIMIEESRAYGGAWNSIRADLERGVRPNYTWFTSHIVPAPWNRERVVLIGDAAHSCPPTIVQGAAQALEDALVLTELLVDLDELDQQLWVDFHERRVPRASAVVEASVQLGRWQLERNQDADAAGLMLDISKKMAEPA